MLGIGFFEIVIIALVCFVAIGPKQLPMVMRKLAGFYRQFVVLKDEFRFQVMNVESSLNQEPEKKLPEKPAEGTVATSREHHG